MLGHLVKEIGGEGGQRKEGEEDKDKLGSGIQLSFLWLLGDFGRESKVRQKECSTLTSSYVANFGDSDNLLQNLFCWELEDKTELFSLSPEVSHQMGRRHRWQHDFPLEALIGVGTAFSQVGSFLPEVQFALVPLAQSRHHG
jgi:hypothetical protein